MAHFLISFIQGTGSWTGKLKELIQKNSTLDNTSKDASFKGDIKVALDGPYGNLALDVTKYERVILIAGGIGITPMFTILKYVYYDCLSRISANKEQSSQPKPKYIHLLWTVRGIHTIIRLYDKLVKLQSLLLLSLIHISEPTRPY